MLLQNELNQKFDDNLKIYNTLIINFYSFKKRIDVKVLGDLIQFGYTESRSARALVRSNNDFNLALDVKNSIFLFILTKTCLCVTFV